MGRDSGPAAKNLKTAAMSPKKDARPPRFAEWLLRMIHSDKGDYTHLGDFNEVYNSIYHSQGRNQAGFWYRFQIIRSLPGFITNKLYWSKTMFKNYLTLTIRNFIKNKGFSLINLGGLAVGMACFILILAYVQFELSFDQFHEKGDRIFRLLNRDNPAEANVIEYGMHSPDILVPLLKKDFPEIVRVTRYKELFGEKTVLQREDKNFFQSGIYADSEFLNVFTFPLLKGDPATALIEPNCMVITDSVARKLFGTADPLGETIICRSNYRKYAVKITGVAADTPANSHLQYDYLLSFKTLSSDKSNSYMFNTWNVGNFTIYVETINPQVKTSIEEKFPAFISRHRDISEEDARKTIEVKLQPVADIHLKSRIRRALATNYEIKYVYLFSSIALVILLIACVNYMNLTTSRATSRAKEIGIRKVVGANRKQLIKQFIGESVLTASLATGIALILVRLLLPRFATLIGSDLQINYLQNPTLLLLIIGTMLTVGLAAGVYPALVLSAFQPTRVLKGQASYRKRGSRLRNVLVVIQFSASIVLIIGTMVIFKQLDYIKNTRLGYDREHVVILPIHEQETRRKAQAIKTELLQHPEVQCVSVTSGLPLDIRSRFLGVNLQKDNGEKFQTEFYMDYVDENFLDVFQIELAAGRNFSPEFPGDKKGALVNEALVRQAGWADPIGKELPSMDDNNHIIGVVKDFHFKTFHLEIEPMVLYPGGNNHIAVRINPGPVPARIALLRTVFTKHSQSQPFEFYFLDDAFNRLYKKEQRTGEIFGTFAFVGIIIACLGLLGLASFSVERRTKEIGIRKVLGASALRIAGLLTREFLLLVLIANVIAWPIAYFTMRLWLQNFAYRIPISIWIFLLAVIAALGIAVITISTQTLRAALSNPVDTLRYE